MRLRNDAVVEDSSRLPSGNVYEAMLPRQPLRYLLADDPGAGKTIMSGLLIKDSIRPRPPAPSPN